MPEGTCDLGLLQSQWSNDPVRAEAVDINFGGFLNVFLNNPSLFRISGHPPKVSLLHKKGSLFQQSEDELLAVATSVTSQLFSSSPDPESPVMGRLGFLSSPLLAKMQPEEVLDEKEVMVQEVVARLKTANAEQGMKKDDLGADLVKNARKTYDQICDLWGTLQDLLRAYPDLFVLQGDVPGKEIVKLRKQDDEAKALEEKRTVLEAVKTVLKHNFSVMHPDDLRDELHRSKPMIMGRITTLYGGFNQLLKAESDLFEVVNDPKLLPPPFVRLRWPAFCALCGVWPETPEAWQGHVFSEKHKDMRRSVIRMKDGRDPDRWPVLRMIEERIRRAGGKMKLGNIPNFGKNRPLFATYVRKLYGGFKQLVESNPRFRVQMEDGSADPTVSLVDDWRQDRLEGVVIRIKQKDTLIWIRPDTNPNIEFFLHRDRSLGGREIANSPAFVVPRVGDRISFLPSDVPADPNPFAEGAVVLETVPDFRIRFSGTIVHRDKDRYLLRADFQTAAGPQDAGDMFEIVWRDDLAKMAVDSGHNRVNFVRSCRPSRSYPFAHDVTVDLPQMPSPRQMMSGPRVQAPMLAPTNPAAQQNFAFTTDATYRGRPVALDLSGPVAPVAAQPSASGAGDARSSRERSRFGTWPVVYFDPNASSGQQQQHGQESRTPPSGERTPEKAPSGERTPIKLNPSKPIVEFSFRGNSNSNNGVVNSPNGTGAPPAVVVAAAATTTAPPPASPVAPPSINLSASSPGVMVSGNNVQPEVPREVQSLSGSGGGGAGESKTFKVNLSIVSDEADLKSLLSPAVLQLAKSKSPNFVNTLVSVAMDVGALPVLSFVDGSNIRGEHLVTQEEVEGVVKTVGDLGPEGSSVVRHSLHLFSVITHPISQGLMGYTVKVGRAVVGLADALGDVLDGHKSVLVLGEYCTGKTVFLRDIARRLSKDPSGKLVAVVDSAGELGGAADGKLHTGLGSSRCVRCLKKGQLPDAVDQTVGRHAIACVVVDGICNVEGVNAVLRARRRGVATVISIGASSLAAAACDEVFRPLLSRLPGGRKMPHVRPPFDVAIELTSVGHFIVHPFINASIDALLSKQPLSVPVTRVTLAQDGTVTWEKSFYPNQSELLGD